MHAPVQTTGLGGCGKLFFLNMWEHVVVVFDNETLYYHAT